MTRDHPLAPHRAVPIVIVLVLAVVAVAALKGPDWFRRGYHPLRYEGAIGYAAGRHGVDPYVVAAVINVESGFKPDEVSSAGAVGLMQVLPSTAIEVAKKPDGTGYTAAELREPRLNIWVGTKYLGRLVRRYGGDLPSALAAYNAGSKHADRWGDRASKAGADVTETIDFPETRRYVEQVMQQADDYRSLYPEAFGHTP